MDVLTQSLLGAGMAQSAARSDELKKATIIGGLSGLLADADALIRSSSDSLLVIEYHRHFTHSLLFVPFGALLAALILWPLFRRKLAVGRLYLYCFLGYSLSGVLDAMTSYGTHLFWPVSDTRVAWNIISIVDPIFTVVLLAAVIVAFRRGATRPARVGLMIAASYLLFGTLQHFHAQAVTQELAHFRGHPVSRLLVKPTLGNLLLWRTVYESNGVFYVDAVRLPPFGDLTRYEGGHIEAFNVAGEFPALGKQDILYKDIERFANFSDDFVFRPAGEENIIGDVRYSIRPNGLRPLWGIVFDPGKPQQHADFRVWREGSRDALGELWSMLRGQPIEK